MDLYKLDSKGKLRILKVTTDCSTLKREAGLVYGALTVHTKVCVAKNTGKANETSPEAQAELQAEALIEKKLREGYFKTSEEALTNLIILPQLAKDFFKESKKVVFPCYGQPKLDGMRGLGKEKLLKSRKNLPIETLDHIKGALDGISEFIDGELYAHGKTFQENMKLIKKYRPGATEKVVYHVYDMISDRPFFERYREAARLIQGRPNIELVPTVVLNNLTMLKAYHEQCVSEGYEGCMVRWGSAGYKVNGRSSNLLKYKLFFDVALPIVDITPNDADPTHGTVWVEYKGMRTKTGARLSHKERQDLLTNRDKYIGQIAEIRYFEETDAGLLRFPVFVGFRLDK